MAFIGILTDSSHEPYLKQNLSEIIKHNQILFLTQESLKNVKNIKFQVIILGKKITKQQQELRQLLEKTQYLIFNADRTENTEILKDLSFHLITYGFNSKATITASSVEEQKIMIYLQRGIKNIEGRSIEPQEIEISLEKEADSYAVTDMISLQILSGP